MAISLSTKLVGEKDLGGGQTHPILVFIAKMPSKARSRLGVETPIIPQGWQKPHTASPGVQKQEAAAQSRLSLNPGTLIQDSGILAGVLPTRLRASLDRVLSAGCHGHFSLSWIHLLIPSFPFSIQRQLNVQDLLTLSSPSDSFAASRSLSSSQQHLQGSLCFLFSKTWMLSCNIFLFFLQDIIYKCIAYLALQKFMIHVFFLNNRILNFKNDILRLVVYPQNAVYLTDEQQVLLIDRLLLSFAYSSSNQYTCLRNYLQQTDWSSSSLTLS